MKINSVFTVKLLVFMFCLILSAGTSLFAQNFTQTLRWNADPSIFEYKIVIQDKSGKTIQTLTTEENFIQLSLKEGTYKYKITAYDLLGRESVSTDWINFVVAIAKHPEIKHQKTLEALAEDGKTLEMAVDVDDVTVDTVAELVNVATGEKVKGKLVLETAAGAPAAGLSASETHKATKARFTDVPEGQWKLVITNPSGLSSESEQFEVRDVIKEEKLAAQKAEEERLAREQAEREEAERIAAEKAAAEEAERQRQEQLAREQAEREEQERLAREQAEREEQERIAREIAEQEAREEAERLALEEEERKKQEKIEKKEKWKNKDRPFSVMPGVGVGFILYDSDFFEYYMEKTYIRPALNLQIEYLPIHTNRIRFGLELDTTAMTFDSKTNYYTISLNNLQFQENIVFRFSTKKKKWWFKFKGGGGAVLIQEKLDYSDIIENNRQDKTQLFAYLIAGGGASVIFTPASMFMLQMGVDYYNLFIPETNIGILNPYLSLGLRF